MRRLRFHPAGHLVEVTSRTIHGRLLLRPGAFFNEIVVGILGRAQVLFSMEVQFVSVLSNHYHLLLLPRNHQQLSGFMAYLNGNLAKEVGRLYGWKEKVWGRRYQAIVVSDEEKAQIDRLRYLFAQGVKEGLVAQVGDWPGPDFLGALLQGTPLHGTWFDRTQECKARRKGLAFGARDFTTPVTLVLSPLPCWQNLSPEEHRQAVLSLVADIDATAAAERAASQREPLGAAVVLQQPPHAMPARSKRTPAPWFHTATRAALLQLKQAYSDFLAQYRDAAKALRKGLRTITFPPGSFPPALPWVEA
jgi:hypothetical protein